MNKIVVCTGGFDPIHSGHISYLQDAKKLGDKLFVGLNSDEWLTRKKGKAFLPFLERKCILENIRCVDQVLSFDDSNGSAVCLLEQLKLQYPSATIIFANGGDRTAKNIPETVVNDIIFTFGVGGENKSNSSSWILEEWKHPKTKRDWGYYRVLHNDGQKLKVKELTVDPGQSLSMQLHNSRNEFWFISSGEATLYTLNIENDVEEIATYKEESYVIIEKGEWHRLSNKTDKPLKVIEIQYGDNCVEEDIVRRFNLI